MRRAGSTVMLSSQYRVRRVGSMWRAERLRYSALGWELLGVASDKGSAIEIVNRRLALNAGGTDG
jgi:hypothetical protein